MAKVALPKLARDPNGNLVVTYIDAETMTPIPDSLMIDYEIYNAHDQALKEMGIAKPKAKEEPKETAAKEIVAETRTPGGGSSDRADSAGYSYGHGNKGYYSQSPGTSTYSPPAREEMSGKRDAFGKTKMGGFVKGAAGMIGGRMVGGALGGMVAGPMGAMGGALIGSAIGGRLARGPKEQYSFPDQPDAPSVADETVEGLFSDDPEVAEATATGKNPLGVGTGRNAHYNPDDPLGRQRISEVDFDNIGLHPDMAAKTKAFAKEAQELGLDLSVDVANTRRSQEQQQALAATGKSRTNLGYHNTGFAVDISPTAIDAQGNITDQATLAASRQLAEKHGFGLLNPSWDPAHMQATVPGANAASLFGMPRDALGNAILSPSQSLSVRGNAVPTPTERPAEMNTGFVSQDERFDENKSVAQNVIDKAKDVSLDALDGVDMTQKSPAEMSNLGFGPTRTADEMERMGLTIAGELSPEQLEGLSRRDPTALAEFANVMATMENRAQSKTLGTMKETLNTQYNSLMGSKMGVTTANFSQYKDTIMDNVNAFYSGNITPSTPKATHYYNPDIANPGWATSLKSAAMMGSHKFGQLVGEFLPGSDYTQALSRYAGAQINNQVNKGFAAPDYDFASKGPSFGSLMSDSPSETGASRFGGAGLGYSAKSGMDSPSEGGSRFGGFGLGSGYSSRGGLDSPSERSGGRFGGFGLGDSGSGGYSGKSGKADSPSESGGRFGGSGLGSSWGGGGVKSDKSSYGGGPVDKAEKGWGGGSSKSSSSGSKSGGGLGKNSDGSDNGWGGRSGSV